MCHSGFGCLVKYVAVIKKGFASRLRSSLYAVNGPNVIPLKLAELDDGDSDSESWCWLKMILGFG